MAKPSTKVEAMATENIHINAKDVPSRATSIEKILLEAEKKKITNELLIKVGLRMNHNLICGSNARCVAMLITFKSLMHDLENNCPVSQDFLATTIQSIKTASDFLELCRPLSISMTNTIKHFKEEISKLQQQAATLALNPNEAKGRDYYREQLNEFIDRFIYEEIISAQRGICENASNKIDRHNDVILVYGCSAVIQHILLQAKRDNKNFKVIVVDCQPNYNGRRMLKYLSEHDIPCTYTLINSLSYIMRQANKVLLGAHAILANGYVMAQIGTSQIALMAKACNKPVLVCCETYKFSERVYVDSFPCNESVPSTENFINLLYDVTPPEFITMLLTERSTIPALSVPAVIRYKCEQAFQQSNV